MDDDFMDDNHTEKNNDYILEQKSTDRFLNELTINGYRDARQKYMEDEKLTQLGFDIGYKQLVKLAFMTGQIRAICSNIPGLKNDSAFLARLNDKLEKIEKLNYEKLLNWKVNKINEEVEPCLDDLRLVIFDIENKLNEFKNLIFSLNKLCSTNSQRSSSTTSNNKNDNNGASIIDMINKHLDSLELNKSVIEKISENELKDNEKNLAINDLINNFNFQ